ncbi:MULTISPECIES: hypothetical protein [unclassified Streptomyces]|uniref:hypothetical protein n=1 Tax=unclassified Streptomyces TaxID=2593676 RepID=UPI002E80D007|nr:hypothetical protein [Streptomyces sp. NBC_00589]WTI40894.1 hypothetical protein OIC96_40825 [Streptomyces sp. NBC_00775]WUB25422.1 hypothetical protein OHA51_08905 [Streptomyces sp. NBC_00589]
MWPGQQPPGGEQNPQDQNPYQQPGYQQPNPYQQPGYQQTGQPGYQQPGYQQPNAYGQQPGQEQWGAPSPMGAPEPPSGGGNRTKVIAIVAATAVVVAAGVTGFLVLGGSNDDKADGGKDSKPSVSPSPDPSASASDDNPRGGDDEKPTIAGWKVVVNPKWGTAFDVPADWEVESPGTSIGFEKHNAKAGDKPIIMMSAPAYFKSKWCTSDDDKDGTTEDTPLGAVGTKGASGAKNADEVAVNQVPWWVYGGYTQPDKKSITFDKKAKPYTTTSGVEGSIAWARSKNTPQKGKCASDGKAITFGFKNSAGDYVAWNLYGATGVDQEIPDATILKILSTVRLHGDPTSS